MFRFFVLENIFEKEIFNGFSLSSFDWWVDLIVIAIALVVFGGIYFCLAWLFGRFRFNEEDKEFYRNYRSSGKKERKAMAKQARRPVKNVIAWKKIRPWFIPVVSVVCIIALAATPVLYTLWDVLKVTLSGSDVTIYDTAASRAAAKEAEQNVVYIQEEGTVLLKNKDKALPLNPDDEQDKKINIFGSCAYGLFFNNGGSGSFQTDGRVEAFPRVAVKLEEALVEQGFEINNSLFNLVKNYYRNKSVSIADTDHKIFCGINTYGYSEIVPTGRGATLDPIDYELPVSAYNQAFDDLGGQTVLENAKEFSDTAMFAITRHGSEDADMNYRDLKLTDAETAAINMLKANFGKVIILLNVPTVIEARFLNDDAISAAIFMGHPGLTGTRAVAEIIAGKVNPSGHLVDTWPYDVKSAPSYQCFGNDTTLSHTGASNGSFTNYQEGIYVGYRYYVTRAKVDNDFNYDDYVQYSFGHGLSYTTFEKKIVEFTNDPDKQTISIGVSIKNTGDVSGKDVIQIYTHAPYNNGGIEKSWYSLTAFSKTDEIEPNGVKNYLLSFSYKDFASWSTEKGYYLLEKGEYEFSLRENVWDIVPASSEDNHLRKATFSNDVEFKTSKTGKQYENIFQDVEWGAGNDPIQYLSRSDFAGTWKNTDQIDKTAVSDKFPGGTSNTQSGERFSFSDGTIDEPQPTLGADNGLTLRDLKDADWDDPNWELLLDQLSLTDLRNIVDQGSFQTAAINSIGKEASRDYDGPSAAFHSGTGHPSEVTLACSWSGDIARIMGESIGKEGAARGLSGWYAPGINTHRSPFGGRNFEYYSEDPLISGIMAGYTSQGCMKYGVYAYAKHFLLNDQEKNRTGVFVWASEQAIREIYARGFEIYVDMGGIGIMSSFNCIGSWWAGASEALLTTLLREEWGFHGVVVTDYVSSPYMAVNIGIRAGNDLWLNKNPTCDAQHAYNQAKKDVTILLRRSAKNILYACAHSNNVWTLEDYQAVGIDEIKKATDRS